MSELLGVAANGVVGALCVCCALFVVFVLAFVAVCLWLLIVCLFL